MNTIAELIHEVPSLIDDALEEMPEEERRASVATRLPAMTRFLERAGICYARVSYDGSGSDEAWSWEFVDAGQRPVAVELPGPLKEGGERFFRELLESRYPKWSAAEQGGCGEFRWDIVCDALIHVHHHRYIDFETSCHRGL